MKIMIEPSGPLAQLVEQLTLNQWVYRISPKRQNSLDAIPHSDLHLYKSLLGGVPNVDIKINGLCLLNKKGGESHEDAGGSRWLPV